MEFYYVYILLSNKDKTLYTGISKNILKRFTDHNLGKSTYTSQKRPWQIIYYEVFVNSIDAYRRERYFKTNKGKKALKLMLRETMIKLNYKHI